MFDHLSPRLYGSVQSLIRGRNFQKHFVEKYLNLSPGMAVLDVGCGTGWLYSAIRDLHCEYTGIDSCEKRIRTCKERFENNEAFHVEKAEGIKSLPANKYDMVIAFGLLHHLKDNEAKSFAEGAHRCLKKGGQLITADGVFLEKQNIVKKILIKLDRGKFIRNPHEYKKIIQKYFPNPECYLEDKMFFMPYDLFVIRAFS